MSAHRSITTGYPPLGAFPGDEGRTTFRVWAPAAGSLAVLLGGAEHELTPAGDGIYAAVVPARAGDDYQFVLDGDRRAPDPWSRAQPEGLRGPSRVVDVRDGPPDPPGWDGVALEDLVIYELHVGTFSAAGTFDGVIPRLAALRELGVTAIEVMPVATFAGHHGWGYDGVYVYAPHPAYGGPDGLKRLIAAAHERDLGVILDVVYNHMGAGSDAVCAFGPYLTDRAQTIWGQAIDFSKRPVREWALQNAEMWVRDYGVDGLRLDAVHSIVDDSDPHVMAELAQRIKAVNPGALLISEMTSACGFIAFTRAASSASTCVGESSWMECTASRRRPSTP
jgi:maltooligosyltrehalose trehalohydrolase